MNEVEKIGNEVLTVVEAPFKWIDKAARVINAVVTDDPLAKTILTTLVQKTEAIGTDVLTDFADKGLNPVTDIATIKAIEDLASYVKLTVVPFVEQAYGTLKTDLAA
jgi:hypothetical protein